MNGAGLQIVSLSGGKDSTAMALKLRELNPGTDYTYICTPTGDELPELLLHWFKLEKILGKPLLYLRHRYDLNGLVEHFKMIPNSRARFCTRMLKMQVAEAFYMRNPGSVVYVGLRADEEERKGGIFNPEIVRQRYPLREWGWGIDEVWSYLSERGVCIPERTDCARCFFQQLHEWYLLWKRHPDIYAHAEAQEAEVGYTWRGPS